MSSIKLEALVLRKLYDDKNAYNNGFKIFNVMVLPDYLKLVKNQNSITISGILPDFSFNEKVSLEIEEVTTGKYVGSYKVKNLIINSDMFNQADFNKNTLKKLDYAPSTIDNILSVYPNICNDIIEGREIDYTKIKSFSKRMYNSLKRKVKDFQQEFQLMLEFKEFNFSFSVAKNILATYKNLMVFKEKFSEDPYGTLCNIKGLSYKSVDKILLEQNPDLRISVERSKSALLFLLEQEEIKGSSYIDGNECYKLFRELVPECKDLFMKALKDNPNIYVDYDKKIVARTSTFKKEKYIADKLLQAKNLFTRDYNFNTNEYHKIGNDIFLSKKQQEILSIIEKSPISILCGYAGCGKAQPLNSLVLTNKGFKRMYDIKVDTKVYGEDGRLYKVIGVYPQGKKKVYRVYFHDNKYTECTEEHLWTVVKHQHFNKTTQTIELKELFNERLEIDGKYRYSVPVCKPIKFKKRKTHISPRVLANFLSGQYINKKDYLILKNIYGLSRNFLFIPKDFLHNSIDIRKELLKELYKKSIIDQDCDVYYEIETPSVFLKKDIEYLIRGLGYLCVTLPPKKMNEQFIIRFAENAKYRFITNIKYVGEKECQCIEVNNPTQLYLTDHFIVTHNTFSIKAVTTMLKNNNKSFALFAPTGRASKVLKDNTGFDTSTIHRQLMKLRSSNGDVERQITDVDFVICDESTMIDINLMFDLLQALDLKRTSLLFICDPAQLLSVGCGNVLTDMIKSKVFPTVFLDEVFRYNEGGISYVATEIRDGKNYLRDVLEDKKEIVLGNKGDYIFYNIDDDSIIDKISNIYQLVFKNTSVDELDLVCLSAYNKGKLGVFALNQVIQKTINPLTQENKTNFSKLTPDGTLDFRKGDRVIQTINNYKANVLDELYLDNNIIDINHISTNGEIFNGEDGKIICEKRLSNGEPILIIKFNDTYYVYKKEDLNSLSLGYAITIHKSQGSSFKNVIVVSPNSHKFFTTRNLLYVACTRAREKIIQIGSPDLVRTRVKVNETTSRKTFLFDLLK